MNEIEDGISFLKVYNGNLNQQDQFVYPLLQIHQKNIDNLYLLVLGLMEPEKQEDILILDEDQDSRQVFPGISDENGFLTSQGIFENSKVKIVRYKMPYHSISRRAARLFPRGILDMVLFRQEIFANLTEQCDGNTIFLNNSFGNKIARQLNAGLGRQSKVEGFDEQNQFMGTNILQKFILSFKTEEECYNIDSYYEWREKNIQQRVRQVFTNRKEQGSLQKFIPPLRNTDPQVYKALRDEKDDNKIVNALTQLTLQVINESQSIFIQVARFFIRQDYKKMREYLQNLDCIKNKSKQDYYFTQTFVGIRSQASFARERIQMIKRFKRNRVGILATQSAHLLNKKYFSIANKAWKDSEEFLMRQVYSLQNIKKRRTKSLGEKSMLLIDLHGTTREQFPYIVECVMKGLLNRKTEKGIPQTLVYDEKFIFVAYITGTGYHSSTNNKSRAKQMCEKYSFCQTDSVLKANLLFYIKLDQKQKKYWQFHTIADQQFCAGVIAKIDLVKLEQNRKLFQENKQDK